MYKLIALKKMKRVDLSSSEIKELIKKGVEQGCYPQYVYKYRVSDTTKNPYFDSIIKTNSLKFSSPEEFNDPFDCQLQPVIFPSQEEVMQFLNRIAPTLPPDIISNYATYAITNPQKFAEILKNAIKFDDKGILCLSKESDNILLWSHYADKHYGVCLKFDMLEDPDFFSIPLTVKYEKDYPIYNHMTESNDVVTKMIKTKFELWEYEKEIRIFKHVKGICKFKKTALTEIIFGCNTPQAEINRIKNLVSTNGYGHLTFKQTEKKNGKYGLTLKSV